MARTRSRRIVQAMAVDSLYPDNTNPRETDQARMALLVLSLRKLGFLMPVYATPAGMLLSGHQRLTAAKVLGIETVPVIVVDVKEADVKGVNIIFNRATNDFSAFDTGGKASTQLHYTDVVQVAEDLPDYAGEDWHALHAAETPIAGIGTDLADKYDKKATVTALQMLRMGIRIPVVMSASGQMVNGIHRLFAAKEAGERTWPVIVVPDEFADVANTFLNYLSMDFAVGTEFASMLRYSAYRRPQNNRGLVPKAYRFWANGCRTLPDKDSYSVEYWTHFRDLHGNCVVDFGAGLGKVAPFLQSKGIECIDFEPYRIDPESDVGVPSPDYSRAKASEFLKSISNKKTRFGSIFLASVLNSVPFPKDRMAVLAIVHALSSKETVIYGTCRDISDFNYEYGGIRNANYFVFDSEPGVRVGDVMRNPKIQKFHTQEEADTMFSRLWNGRTFWPGGNVFYFKASAPKGINPSVLRQALILEFELPYADGSFMGKSAEAIEAFSLRTGFKMQPPTDAEIDAARTSKGR